MAPLGAIEGDPPSAGAIGPTEQESSAIVATIRPSFSDFAGRYDTRKYWPEVYARVRAAFLAPSQVSAEILQDALLWKYGHLGKSGIPAAHRNLISQLQREWPSLAAELPQDPEIAFTFLNVRLGGKTRFITVAFLVHLLFQEQTPIIDQHNFRAVNTLISAVRPNWTIRKKPSGYADVLLVASFMESVTVAWSKQDPTTAPSLRDLDKFLMMYGKSIKKGD